MNLKPAISFLRSREFRFYWLPPLLLVAGIMALASDWGSSQMTSFFIWFFLEKHFSPAQLKQINLYLRIAGHILAYGCLYMLWDRAFGEHLGYTRWRSVLWSLGLCLAVSLMDEGRQYLVPTRTGSLRDVGLDTASASLAAFFSYLSRARQVRRKSSA